MSVTLLRVHTVAKCTTILSSLSSLPLPSTMITICNTSLTTSPPNTGDVNQTLIEIGIPIGLSTLLVLFIILILIVVLLFHNYVIQKKYKHKSSQLSLTISTIEMEEVRTQSTHSLLSHSSGDNYIHLIQDMSLYPSHHQKSSFTLSTAPSIPNEIPEINVRAPTPIMENDLISLDRTEPFFAMMANTPKPSTLGLSTIETEEGCSHRVSDHLLLPHSRSTSETSLIADDSPISSGYETSSQPSCYRGRTHSMLSTQSTISTHSLSSHSSSDNYIHLSQDMALYPSHHDQSNFNLPTALSIPNEIPEITVRAPTPISLDRTEPFSLTANIPKPSMPGLSTTKVEEGRSHGVSDHLLLPRSRSTSDTSSIGDYSPISSGYETSSQPSSYHERPHSILSTQSTHSLSSHSSSDNYIHLSQDMALYPNHHDQSSFTSLTAPSIPNEIPEINVRPPTPPMENDLISQDRTEPFLLMANTPKPSTLGLSTIKGCSHGVSDHFLLLRSRSTSETSSIGDYSTVSSGYETSSQPSSCHGHPHSILSTQSTLSTRCLSSHSTDDIHFILDGNDIYLLDVLK